MITIQELFDQRSEAVGVRPTAQIAYVAIATAGEDEQQILDYASLAIPIDYNGLRRTTIAIDERSNNTTWRLVATFEFYESTYSFDTGGGTQHITNSITTRNRYAPTGETAPDFKGAIGYDGQNVAGVDIQVPVYNFSETHYFEDIQITPAYKATLFNLTGSVNNGVFRGFQVGEVLFLGASGTKRGNERWELQYRFASLPNKTDFQVGDIQVAIKYGWDYMWVLYDTDVDSTAKSLIKKPAAVYIEQVYPGKSFALLGIGS